MSLDLSALDELYKAITQKPKKKERKPRRHTVVYPELRPKPPERELKPKQKIPLSSEEIRLIYFLIFRKVSRTNLKIALKHIIDQLTEYYNQL